MTPTPMIFDPDQQRALAAIDSGANVFVTGSAGTGKSAVTVEAIRQRLKNPSLRVCATTGVAALNLRDKLLAVFGEHVAASTVYRWAGIGLGPRENQTPRDCLEALRRNAGQWRATCARLCKTSTVIIDEVSMLPGRVLEFIDLVCRTARCSPRPFGGMQVVAVGDFLQLPPVAKNNKYDWAFLSPVWERLNFTNISLSCVHRQAAADFVDILNQFRVGRITPGGASVLKKRVAVFPPSSLMRLLTHNAQVDKWNNFQLSLIDGQDHVSRATCAGRESEVEWLRKNICSPEILTIKIGARVMITANLADTAGTLVAANGETGTVKEIDDGAVIVSLDHGRDTTVSPKTWEFERGAPMTGTITQLPLRLAWGCTIHKSQGLTLSNALIDIRAAREPGQAYVAVSRVTSIDGLHLKDWLQGVFISHQAIAFQKRAEQDS